MADDKITLSESERALVRAAIKNDMGWAHVRVMLGIDSSALGTSMCVDVCTILCLHIPAILAGASDMKVGIMNEAFETSVVIDKFEDVASMLPERDRVFGQAVIKTICERQDGRSTDRQLSKLRELVNRAGDNLEPREPAPAAPQGRPMPKEPKFGFSDEPAPKPAAPKTAATSDSISIEVPEVQNLDPAGAALAAMVAPHLIALIEGKVRRVVEGALEHVTSTRLEIPRADGSTFTTTGIHHPMFATLVRAMSARQVNGRVPGIWLVGPASSGKTHGVEQAAEAIGLPFFTQGACSMAHELTGFIDANGRLQRTPFRDAFENGGVCLLDELDSYDPQATLAVNAALANGVCAFPDGMVKRHIDCIVVGAANTNGQGANATYVGRNRLDAAFLSRFPVKLDWPLDVALEQATSGNEQFAKRVQAARARAEANGVKTQIDARHSMAGAGLIAAGFSEDEAANLTYLAGLSAEQRRMVEGH